MTLLHQVAILLIAAVLAVPLFKRLGLGTVLGYLFAGLLIGPFGLRLITDVESILHFSEFGVVLLLFLIGLELNPSRLWVMRKAVFGLGGAQVLGCAAVLGGLGMLLGYPPSAALVAGFGLSLSSTAFVLPILGEKKQLATPYGQAMTRGFVDALAGSPVKVLAELTFSDSSTTFTAQAQQVVQAQPSALFVPASAAQLELIASQLATAGALPTWKVTRAAADKPAPPAGDKPSPAPAAP